MMGRRPMQRSSEIHDGAGAEPGSTALLPGDEERRWTPAWNRRDAVYPAERCIHHLFAEQAARTPDAVALVHEESSLTYRELDAWANRLARRLSRVGVGPETRVGICLERGPELVVSFLAVM